METGDLETLVLQTIRKLVREQKHGTVSVSVVAGKPVLIKVEETTKL